MKTKVAALIVIGLLAVLSSPSFGLTVSLNNAGTTTAHEVWATPGQAINVDVNLDADYRMYALDAVIQASDSDVFNVFMRTDLWPWIGAGGMGSLSPTSPQIGWHLLSPTYFGPGTCRLATLGLVVASDAPVSTYTLNLTDIDVSPNRLAPYFAAGTPGADFIVHVVPEPAACLVVFMLGCVVVRRR